ncbi:motility protein A [Zavarzinia sp. CC-PAN008]|uniref:motility protein A n=1 Tax=Zavarzinia sp. CC-PAN008 TaxID=3243332 RepID=UPI003F7462F6
MSERLYARTVGRPRPAGPGAMPDLATLAGLFGGLVLIGIAVALGGSPAAFLDLPSALIVLGGTLAVTTISFSLGDMRQALRSVGGAISGGRPDVQGLGLRLLKLAEQARKDGTLTLQPVIRQVSDPFLARALGLLVDNTQDVEIERTLRLEVGGAAQRRARSIAVLRRAAEVSPAMGLIGTLVGLVQMLGRLEDPAVIGPAMAIALLTTFYGAVLSTMVASPLAGKLERNGVEDTLAAQMVTIAALSMARQENPRRLEMSLNALLPPDRRLRYFN